MNTQAITGSALRVQPTGKCNDGLKDSQRRSVSFEGLSREEGLLDYKAAAAYLAVSERHVRELWAKRRLAAIKVGRSVRFSREDLDAFIATNRVRAVR